MNHKSNSQKVARVPHMAQPNLIKAVVSNDIANASCQLIKGATREVCENLLCMDSTFSLATVAVFTNKRVN